MDLISSQSDYFIGRIGTLGSRAGNFALQNSDLIIFLGTRNNIRQVSYNWDSFAKHAKKIIVDIDQNAIDKLDMNIAMSINCEAKTFLNILNKPIKA